MDRITDMLSAMKTPEYEQSTKIDYQEYLSNCRGTESLRPMAPHPSTRGISTSTEYWDGLSDGHDLEQILDAKLAAPLKPQFPPLDILPCANVEVAKYTTCKNQGTMACSACRLVSYCSKTCQTKHWSIHRSDCKNAMRFASWKPAWMRENRTPSFMNGDEDGDDFQTRGLSHGMALWGNTPAVDVVNLSANENDPSTNINVAFPASGDLRHALLTVNRLPENYTGSLKILINDINPHVTSRNLVLLLILTLIQDEVLAADIALHFWYSVFLPSEYQLCISTVITKALASSSAQNARILNVSIGPHSSLGCPDLADLVPHLRHFVDDDQSNIEPFQHAYDSVRQAPSRRDFRDRMYLGLRPSHRIAFQEYRRFGIVLPFGAINAHFNAPNRSLFSVNQKWLQTDFADPLGCWDVEAIIATGKAHGATEEDIYGCLYFFLSDSLRVFTRRLRTFKVSVFISSMDATALSKSIIQGELSLCGISQEMRFDRISVSNIFDFNYVGLAAVLANWSQLLAETGHSTLLGYFMNWVHLQKDGRVSTAGYAAAKEAFKHMMADNRVVPDITGAGKNRSLDQMHTKIISALSVMDSYYDSSKAFSTFLNKQGLNECLRKEKLRLKEKHTIVPHRLQTAIDAPADCLPKFDNNNSWYYYNYVTASSSSERYVEFCRK